VEGNISHPRASEQGLKGAPEDAVAVEARAYRRGENESGFAVSRVFEPLFYLPLAVIA
jgi:hypothetical protein